MNCKEQYYHYLISAMTKMESLFNPSIPGMSLDVFRNQFTMEEKESFRLAIQQARLGLNKEKIDALDYYIDYENILAQEWKDNDSTSKNRVVPWMQVTKGYLKKYSFKTYIKDIRNAFLHASYIPEYDFDGKIQFIHITYQKSHQQYHEAILQQPQFDQFIEALYGNYTGMTFDHTYFSIDLENHIDTDIQLDHFLKTFIVITTEIHGKPTNTTSIYQKGGYHLFQSLCDLKNIVDCEKFVPLIEQLEKQEPNFTWYSMQITPIYQEMIKQYLTKHYPDFYSWDDRKKYKVIMELIELLISPHQAISRMFECFEILLCDKEMGYTDIIYEPYMISLQLLKIYAILYRFQNHMYDKGELQTYQMDQFYDKTKQKHTLSNIQKLTKIRNALAHGNMMIYIASFGDDIAFGFQDHYALDKEKHTDIYITYQDIEMLLKKLAPHHSKQYQKRIRDV